MSKITKEQELQEARNLLSDHDSVINKEDYDYIDKVLYKCMNTIFPEQPHNAQVEEVLKHYYANRDELHDIARKSNASSGDKMNIDMCLVEMNGVIDKLQALHTSSTSTEEDVIPNKVRYEDYLEEYMNNYEGSKTLSEYVNDKFREPNNAQVEEAMKNKYDNGVVVGLCISISELLSIGSADEATFIIKSSGLAYNEISEDELDLWKNNFPESFEYIKPYLLENNNRDKNNE